MKYKLKFSHQVQVSQRCVQVILVSDLYIMCYFIICSNSLAQMSNLMVNLFFLAARADECMGVMPRRWNLHSWLHAPDWLWSSTLRNPARRASRSPCWMEAKVRKWKSKNTSTIWRPQTIILSRMLLLLFLTSLSHLSLLLNITEMNTASSSCYQISFTFWGYDIFIFWNGWCWRLKEMCDVLKALKHFTTK